MPQYIDLHVRTESFKIPLNTEEDDIFSLTLLYQATPQYFIDRQNQTEDACQLIHECL